MRRAIIAVAVAVGLLIAVLWWKSRTGGDAEAPPRAGSAMVAPPVAAIAPTPTAPSAPTLAPSPTEPTDQAAGDEARPQPVPLSGSQTPPPLDGKRSEPAAPQKPFTPEETIAKREADLKLLDDTKARLEDELKAARTANDQDAVHVLEVRLARLGDLRKKRGDELDKLRAGSGSAR